jgi:hypothetical protein
VSSPSFTALVAEKAILENQLNQLRYYLAGSGAITFHVDDVLPGQHITCQKEKIHEIAAALVRPASSCIDIGPGLRPQKFLLAKSHLLIEPHHPYAEQLARTYPDKPVIRMDGLRFLEVMMDQSVDTIFLLDVIEHLDKKDGEKLLENAKRVARSQVIVFTPLGFMPQHYSEIGGAWGNVTHNELQNHMSGWSPSDFEGSTCVICDDYHDAPDQKYGAFYAIVNCDETPLKGRLILVSEDCPDFQFRNNDLVVSDVAFSECSWLINSVPKRNQLMVPLQIIAESSTQPIDLLRRSVINFELLEHYFRMFEEVLPIGNTAEVVVANLKSEE